MHSSRFSGERTRCSLTGWYVAYCSHGLDLESTADSCGSCAKNAHVVNPLTSFIYLPRDQSARRRAMLGMKARKLETVGRFVHLRYQSLDLFEPYFSETRCRNNDGDFCISRYDIIQFDGVQSVRQVYDALMFTLINQEISMSEKLGDITLREEHDELWDGTGNHRLVSNDASGLQQEVNCASFVQFYEERHPGCTEPGYAVLLSDFVDVDDLHPYEPTKRLRRDVTVASLLTPYRRPRSRSGASDDRGDDELTVVLRHVALEKLRRPEMAVDISALRDLHQGMHRWGDVMINHIQDIMAGVTLHERSKR